MADPLAVGPVEFDPERVDVDHLDAFVAEHEQHRVGRYFETLLHYWLAYVRKVEILGVGLQLIDDQRRTLGELDFLFRDESGVVCHCEASVKYFMHYPNADGSHFPGPAARDNFERKASKLFDTQLLLGRQHRPEIAQLQGFVRGIVFYEVGGESPDELPARMAAGHGRGHWVYASQVEALEPFGSRFQVVAKPNWFAPVAREEGVSFGRFVDELDSHFDGPAFPVMVSARGARNEEQERCFVVPDAWPGIDPRRATGC